MAVQISGNDITVPRDGSFTRNVTIGGTLTYEDVTNIDSVGLVTARTGIEIGARPGVAASISVDGNMIISGISTFGDDITFTGATSGRDVIFDTSLNQIRAQDNAKLCAGSSSDLEIYHNATNSYIDNYTGHIYVRNNLSTDNGGNIYLQAKSGEDGIIVNDDGAVELYHDNSKKLETNNSGVTVTGTVTADGLVLSDSDEIQFGNSTDFRIYHDGSHSYIRDVGTGQLRIQSDVFSVENAAGTENILQASQDGAVTLYHDNSLKLTTTSTGITVTGSVSVTTEPAFRVGLINSNTSVSHNNNYTIPFDTDSGNGVFDTNGCFDTSNHRFTPNLAGYYYLHFQVRCDLPSADHLYQARIKHSSGEYVVISQEFNKSGNDNSSAQASCIQYFNGSSDYVTAEFYQNSGSTVTVFGGTAYHYQTFFEGYFVRSA